MKNPTEVSGPLVFFKIKHNAGLELTNIKQIIFSRNSACPKVYAKNF